MNGITAALELDQEAILKLAKTVAPAYFDELTTAFIALPDTLPAVVNALTEPFEKSAMHDHVLRALVLATGGTNPDKLCLAVRLGMAFGFILRHLKTMSGEAVGVQNRPEGLQ